MQARPIVVDPVNPLPSSQRSENISKIDIILAVGETEEYIKKYPKHFTGSVTYLNFLRSATVTNE